MTCCELHAFARSQRFMFVMIVVDLPRRLHDLLCLELVINQYRILLDLRIENDHRFWHSSPLKKEGFLAGLCRGAGNSACIDHTRWGRLRDTAIEILAIAIPKGLVSCWHPAAPVSLGNSY